MADVTCGCCGQLRVPGEVVQLDCHPEISICGRCVHWLAGRLVDRPSITPIFPVHDMAAARDFWTRAGLQVENYSPEYAFVLFNGSEVAHLEVVADLDPARNAAACYIHVADPDEWHDRWQAHGLAVTDVEVQPWGMREFRVRDPSGNTVRIGATA